MPETPMSWRAGGCHCHAVRFEVLLPDEVEICECNCSICRMTGYQHIIVPKERFRLLRGDTQITTYMFNTATARHKFCTICGIKSFYIPRSHPDGFSVNARCLDEGVVRIVNVVQFDGRHWEDHISEISDKA